MHGDIRISFVDWQRYHAAPLRGRAEGLGFAHKSAQTSSAAHATTRLYATPARQAQ
jgi:hypothetical protein